MAVRLDEFTSGAIFYGNLATQNFKYVKLHISTKFQINCISALHCSIFLFLSFQNWRSHVRDSDNESFYLGRTFIIHCTLSVGCYFRPELQLINLRKALVISHFMKHYCLSTVVLWWQNTLMLVAVQYCIS